MSFGIFGHFFYISINAALTIIVVVLLMSYLVTYGRGKGIVTGTGLHTQIGMIADMLQS